MVSTYLNNFSKVPTPTNTSEVLLVPCCAAAGDIPDLGMAHAECHLVADPPSRRYFRLFGAEDGVDICCGLGTNDTYWEHRPVLARQGANTGYAAHIFAGAYRNAAKNVLSSLNRGPSTSDPEILLESILETSMDDEHTRPIERLRWRFSDILDVEELMKSSDEDLMDQMPEWGDPSTLLPTLKIHLIDLENLQRRLDHNARCSNMLRWYKIIISAPADDPSFPCPLDEGKLRSYLTSVTFAPDDMAKSVEEEQRLFRYMTNDPNWDREEEEESIGETILRGLKRLVVER